MYINKHLENLFNFGKIKSAAYSSAKTFPHIEIDNLFDSKIFGKFYYKKKIKFNLLIFYKFF
jgi:hypothetical protein